MKATQDRQYYIDRLRVVATIDIFLFHNSRVYDYGDWGIKNVQTTLGATQFVEIPVRDAEEGNSNDTTRGRSGSLRSSSMPNAVAGRKSLPLSFRACRI